MCGVPAPFISICNHIVYIKLLNLFQTDLKIIPPQVPERSVKIMSVPVASGVESIGNEIFDHECLKLINEYFYGVRIFPGQDPTHVYVGWVTTQYHFFSNEFNQRSVRKASVRLVDDHDRFVDRYRIRFINIIQEICVIPNKLLKLANFNKMYCHTTDTFTIFCSAKLQYYVIFSIFQ